MEIMNRSMIVKRKTPRMVALERTHNKLITQLLRELYAETGSITAVAQRLGTSISTISHWLARFDIPTRATITPGEFLFQDGLKETREKSQRQMPSQADNLL